MRLMRRLALPASENYTAVVLAASLIVTALLLWAVIWQSNIITYQRDIIRDLWGWRG